MLDFIYGLYKDEHFAIYLAIALVVLIVLFVVVLIFGKKDQKLEETKRLQKLEIDSFKEKEEEPQKVEVPKVKEEVPPVVEDKMELPSLASDEVHATEFVPDELPKENISNEPLLSEEESVINFDEEGLQKDLEELENIKREFSNIELPKMEEEKKEPSRPQVFSSVYVKKDEPVATQAPEVKNVAPVQPEPPKAQSNGLFYIEDDEDTIDLPSLKN